MLFTRKNLHYINVQSVCCYMLWPQWPGGMRTASSSAIAQLALLWMNCGQASHLLFLRCQANLDYAKMRGDELVFMILHTCLQSNLRLR